MSAQLQAVTSTSATTFVRRTRLEAEEYRVNFKQLDNDVISALVSPAARAITPLMSTIYLSLLTATPQCWEREGVLRFTGETEQEGRLTAWQQLRKLTGVANTTLAKALKWLHEEGIIGYVAHKNGIGIRIFLNRAAASIRPRAAQKNLASVHTPFDSCGTPANGTAFSRKGIQEHLDNYSALARKAETAAPALKQASLAQNPAPIPPDTTAPVLLAAMTSFAVNKVINELKPEMEAANRRELDATREWFLKHALPKATRVAQRETYELLRAHQLLAKKPAPNSQLGQPAPALEQTGKTTKIAEALQAWGSELQRLATSAQLHETVKAVCWRIRRRLNELQATLILEGQGSTTELDQALRQLETELTDSLWQTLSANEQTLVTKAAREALRPYNTRMDEITFEETLQRRIAMMLLERQGLPRLSLFYLG